MVRFLSQEWLDEWLRHGRDQPRRPNVTVRLQYVVQDAPGGDVLYYWLVRDGRLEAAGLGPTPGGAELTLTISYENALRISRNEISPNMAFMRGWVKPTGRMAMLMTLMPITGSPAYKDVQLKVGAVTEYDSAAVPTSPA